MKKPVLLFAAVAMIAFVSCKKETTTTEVVTPETEVVAPVESDTDTITVKTEETDGTSVNVDAKGIDVKSSDGTKKTSVEVKDGGAAVEVKK